MTKKYSDAVEPLEKACEIFQALSDDANKEDIQLTLFFLSKTYFELQNYNKAGETA